MRLQTREHVAVAILPQCELLLCRYKSRPDLGISREVGPGKVRHHADDRIRLTIEPQRFSDRVSIAAEPIPPQRMAQNHSATSRLHIRRNECPPEQRFDTQVREEIL